MEDPRKGNGAYMSLKDRLRTTAIGKSRPSETPARRADPNVSLGGDVGVEKKSRCLWNAEHVDRGMIIKVASARVDGDKSKLSCRRTSSRKRTVARVKKS
jgi:hypothetical protein